MNLNEITNKVLESKDITLIAPKDIVAHIIMRLNIMSNWTVSMNNYDIEDDNILLLTKLEVKNPTLVVETALLKDGRLVEVEGGELIIEQSSMETIDRLGVLEKLLEMFKGKNICVFNLDK